MIAIITIQTEMNLYTKVTIKKEVNLQIYNNQKINQQEENNNYQMEIAIKGDLKVQ